MNLQYIKLKFGKFLRPKRDIKGIGFAFYG
jgi:hypothetical protein